MEIVAFLALLVIAPIGLLVWTRRHAASGAPDTDPQGNRDIGRGGGEPRHTQDTGWGGGSL